MQTEIFKYNNDKQWAFMSFVKIFYDYIRSFTQYVNNQNGYITLPIKYEDIKERHEHELKAANLDLESIKKNSTLYKFLSKHNSFRFSPSLLLFFWIKYLLFVDFGETK